MMLSTARFLVSSLWSTCVLAASLPSDSTSSPPSASLNTISNLTAKQETIVVPGTQTTLRFNTLPDEKFVSAPDVYMTCSVGLHSLAQSIATRGLRSQVKESERTIEVESSKLSMQHSDFTPHYLSLGTMSDILYGLCYVWWRNVWAQEASIDVWTGEPPTHVAFGYLTNRLTPSLAGALNATESQAATAR